MRNGLKDGVGGRLSGGRIRGDGTKDWERARDRDGAGDGKRGRGRDGVGSEGSGRVGGVLGRGLGRVRRGGGGRRKEGVSGCACCSFQSNCTPSARWHEDET